MQFVKISALALIIGTVGVLSPSSVSAGLITNGDFAAGLTGWAFSVENAGAGTTGVTAVAGAADLGKSGTPGIGTLSQSFSIGPNQSQFKVGFDYLWQNVPPTNPDFFAAEFDYETVGGTATYNLLNESSGAGNFSVSQPFSSVFTLNDIVSGTGTLRFKLRETPNAGNSVGTFVRIDNASVSAVPEPAALAMFSVIGLLVGGRGLVVARRRRQVKDEVLSIA